MGSSTQLSLMHLRQRDPVSSCHAKFTFYVTVQFLSLAIHINVWCHLVKMFVSWLEWYKVVGVPFQHYQILNHSPTSTSLSPLTPQHLGGLEQT